MDIRETFQSKKFRSFLRVVGAVAVLLVVFEVGQWAGARKAAFSYRWGERYYRGLAGPRGNLLPGLDRGDFLSGHGTSGLVIKVSSSTLLVQDLEGVEKVIRLTSKTVVRRLRENLSVGDLKTDDRVAVIGSPTDDGEIEARLIRLLPADLPPPPPFAPNSPRP
ncbi:MAG: hypothetical protein HY978_04005 [Candidatus Liptonbacteria bacterium]|nr:hypothetical protein [Candidatus Liptonbacteria bacterium]